MRARGFLDSCFDGQLRMKKWRQDLTAKSMSVHFIEIYCKNLCDMMRQPEHHIQQQLVNKNQQKQFCVPLLSADRPVEYARSMSMHLHPSRSVRHAHDARHINRTSCLDFLLMLTVLEYNQGCPAKDRPLSTKDGCSSVWHADQMI